MLWQSNSRQSGNYSTNRISVFCNPCALCVAEWAASGVGVLYVATYVMYYFLDRQPRWFRRVVALLFSNVGMAYGTRTISLYEEAGEKHAMYWPVPDTYKRNTVCQISHELSAMRYNISNSGDILKYSSRLRLRSENKIENASCADWVRTSPVFDSHLNILMFSKYTVSGCHIQYLVSLLSSCRHIILIIHQTVCLLIITSLK